ncbi:MAG: hypothetical protein B6245_06470 [Desulfobacteraceae bacterium 4572_88]|nr:MAG: hypothetical protein B6245_06470 [Desulfobacteraceae bacterium 4572_88]
MMKCPVCGLENIPDDKAQCPQCDGDLSCFKVLDELPDELPKEETSPKMKTAMRSAIILLTVLILLLIVFLLYRFNRLEDQSAKLENQSLSMSRQLDAQNLKLKTQESLFEVQKSKLDTQELMLKAQRSDLERQTRSLRDQRLKLQTQLEKVKSQSAAPSVSPKPEEQTASKTRKVATEEQKTPAPSASASGSDFFVYDAKDEDTLWHISKKYYGSGYYFPVLLKHNPHIGVYAVGDKVSVKILRDIGQMKQIYRQIVRREGNIRYWIYTLTEGDTIESVAKKFYKIPEEGREKILALNPGGPLYPGKKIRILLE